MDYKSILLIITGSMLVLLFGECDSIDDEVVTISAVEFEKYKKLDDDFGKLKKGFDKLQEAFNKLQEQAAQDRQLVEDFIDPYITDSKTSERIRRALRDERRRINNP